MSASMEWHLSLHGDAHFSNLEMQHSPKMSATFSKKDLQKTPGKSLTGWKRTSSGEAELRRGEVELCCEGSISPLGLGILGGIPLESHELSREKRNFVHSLIF